MEQLLRVLSSLATLIMVGKEKSKGGALNFQRLSKEEAQEDWKLHVPLRLEGLTADFSKRFWSSR